MSSKNLIKEVLHQPIGMLIEDDLQEMIGLCNLIQDLAKNGINEIQIEGETIPTQSLFNNYVGAITRTPYFREEDKQGFKQFVAQEKERLLNNQTLVSKEDLENHIQTNINYMKTFWDDIEYWKSFNIVIDMYENLVENFHKENIQELSDNVGKALCEMKGEGFDPVLITCNSIAKEETTLMFLTTIFFREEDKKQLVDHYISEVKESREGEERYIDKLWNHYENYDFSKLI